jgi:predicted nucleic acid-binding protein
MPPYKRVYWDSCIFIAWLKDERRADHEMDGIYECVEEVEQNRVYLFTSVATVTEVFETDLSVEIKEMYSRLLKRRNVQRMDTDLRVSELAQKIREFYVLQNRTDNRGKLSHADAVHLATAIHYSADELWTFDDGRHRGRGLLELNGNVAGHELVICKPWAKQLRLDA